MSGVEGLDNIKKQYEEQAKTAVIRKSNTVDLKDGDVAVIKFLSDANKIYLCGFHGVPTKGRYGEYNADVYCMAIDGEACPYCEQIGEDVAITRKRFHAWVYVHKIYHSKQKDSSWMPGKRGKKQYFVETINGVKLLRKGEGKGKYITNKLINLYEELGSLLENTFLWRRTGADRDGTLYDLMITNDSADEFDLPTDLPELMDLKEVAKQYKKFESRQGSEKTLLEKIEESENGSDGPDFDDEENAF